MAYGSVYDFDHLAQFGNQEANLRFLDETGVLTKEQGILEIGSGAGGMLSYFYKKGYDIRGIEVDEDLIRKSETLYGNLPLSLVSSDTLPFADHSFDVVMSFDVFEHIPDSDKHLREVNRVLKDKGFYLLQTPNKYTNVIFETIKTKSFTKWKAQHCSLHSYWQITDRFEKNGFGVEFYDIAVVNEFFKSKLKRHLGVAGLAMLRILNPDRLPMVLKTNFYVKARKRHGLGY
jgi:cyclopropane fatty-acyl-phospholipid synthase-like methyltransferase